MTLVLMRRCCHCLMLSVEISYGNWQHALRGRTRSEGVNGRTILVDYDVFIYAAGFSCQKSTYIYNDEEFATKTELKQKHPNYDPEELRVFTQVEPASHAVQCARM